MTSVNTTPVTSNVKPFEFNKMTFSDPSMRSYLEEFYESKYAPIREHIASMKEAEANGQGARTITAADGTIAHEISAAQYEAAIPSFDKWLELQQTFSAFDMAEQSAKMQEFAKNSLSTLETRLGVDQPSNVRVVFSDGNRILGYINNDGTVVSHNGADVLQDISQEANLKGLTGKAKIAYLKENGAAELSRQYPDIEITEYTEGNTPTRRAFAETWYPDHNVGDEYSNALEDARNFLAQQQATYQQQLKNLAEMRAFLIQRMENDTQEAA